MSNRAEQRREAREQGGSDMTKFYWVFGAVAVIGVGSVMYSMGNSFGTAVSEPIEIEGLDDMSTLVELAQGKSICLAVAQPNPQFIASALDTLNFFAEKTLSYLARNIL